MLRGLFIGIDHYKAPVSRLRGCADRCHDLGAARIGGQWGLRWFR